MKCITSLLLASSLASSLSCAGQSQFKATYMAAVSSKIAIEEAQTLYSKSLNDKIDQCTPPKAKQVRTKRDFLDCLGPKFDIEAQQRIFVAIEAYNSAAIVLSALLTGCEPDAIDLKACVRRTATATELKAQRLKLLQSARTLLALIPGAERLK